MDAMPKEIAEAVCSVMAAIKKLPKSEKNQHGGYMFASIDAFLVAMNPICADAGLFIVQEETDFETVQMQGPKGPQNWLRMRFAFTLGHKTGATWGPIHRSVMVHATGAQAFGSAQSYAQKQFMRSLFQIATGDKDDADFAPNGDMPEVASRQQKRRTQPQKQEPEDFWQSDKLTFPAVDEKDFARKLAGWVANAPDLDRLNKLEADNTAGMNALPEATIGYLIGKITERRAFLSQAPADADADPFTDHKAAA